MCTVVHHAQDALARIEERLAEAKWSRGVESRNVRVSLYNQVT